MAKSLSLFVYFAFVTVAFSKEYNETTTDFDEDSSQVSVDQPQDHRPSARGPTSSKKRNLFDFKAKTISGKYIELDEFRGQALLVVNVASQCGFTDANYKSLVRMHHHFSSTGKFTVLAFPCNQFGQQEPDNDKTINDFVKDVYNVDFPMFSKVNVIDPNSHPIFKYLIDTSHKSPNWNFWKYLINYKGDVIGVYEPWADFGDITKDVRGAVNDAVQADQKHKLVSSGPLKAKHIDYGDGAGGGLHIWAEGLQKDEDGPESPYPGDKNSQRAQRAGSETDTDTKTKPGTVHTDL